jgi:hypothetical protein
MKKTLDSCTIYAKVSNCKKSTLYIKGEVNGSFKKSGKGTCKNKENTAGGGVAVKSKNNKQIPWFKI